MSKLWSTVFFLCFATMASAQTDSEYQKLAERQIEQQEKTIKKLRSQKDDLLEQVDAVWEDNRKLRKTLTNLFLLFRQVKEELNKISLLEEEVRALNADNQKLKDRIASLEKELSVLKRSNQQKEKAFRKALAANNRLKILNAAKSKALAEALKKLARTAPFLGVGFGSNFSGFGGGISFRTGNRKGLGIRIGAGYLPNVLQIGTEASYLNVGMNFFFTDHYYLDASYHRLLRHYDGFVYDYFATANFGRNFVLSHAPALFLKAAVGVLYADGVVGKEFFPSGDLGVLVKF
ncbi:MAG: hypothetical protein AAFV25_01370 [Bacteroidota bacterium]